LPRGSTVVTVLCDGGGRYLSRLYDTGWLAEHGLEPKTNDLTFL
jgi:cysteine synthase A